MTASIPARRSLLRPARKPFARRRFFLIFCLRYGPLFTRGIAVSYTPLGLNHDPDVLGVVPALELTPAAHLAAALRALARHDVPLAGGAEQHLPRGRHLEALLRALVRLHLRHC